MKEELPDGARARPSAIPTPAEPPQPAVVTPGAGLLYREGIFGLVLASAFEREFPGEAIAHATVLGHGHLVIRCTGGSVESCLLDAGWGRA